MNRPDTIFVLTPISRGGSNFGRMLMSLHPDTQTTSIHEDFLLLHSSELIGFADACHRTRGQQAWSNRDQLLDELTQGALRSIRQKIPSSLTVVTRSPTTRGLENIPVFKNCAALVLVRDPRDCAESGTLSFGRSPEYIVGVWERNMAIVERMETNRQVHVVKYEDVAEGRVEIASLFTALGLRSVATPAVASLPVLGSSDIIRDGGALHWRPTPRGPSFNPIGRWQRNREGFWRQFVDERPSLQHVMKRWGYL